MDFTNNMSALQGLDGWRLFTVSEQIVNENIMFFWASTMTQYISLKAIIFGLKLSFICGPDGMRYHPLLPFTYDLWNAYQKRDMLIKRTIDGTDSVFYYYCVHHKYKKIIRTIVYQWR